MLLIKQRSDDSIDSHGLTCTRSTCYKEVRGLGKVEHKDLVGDGSAVGNRQAHLLLLLETLAGNHRVHGYCLWFLVRHLDTDGTFARYRRYDTDTHGSQ